MLDKLHTIVALAVLSLAVTTSRALTAPPAEEKGTYFGVLFGPVAEALYDQLPQLPRQQGVLLTHILPESPAAAADLRRHDILLTFDGQKLRDCEHLARLIRDDKPGRKIAVTYLRAGKEARADATLALGPALKLAEAARTSAELPKAVSKPAGPPPVSVSATPLDNGRLKVTIEYYPEGSSRLKALTWEGAPADLDGAARPLPERERQLARVALERLRTLHAPKAAERR